MLSSSIATCAPLMFIFCVDSFAAVVKTEVVSTSDIDISPSASFMAGDLACENITTDNNLNLDKDHSLQVQLNSSSPDLFIDPDRAAAAVHVVEDEGTQVARVLDLEGQYCTL